MSFLELQRDDLRDIPAESIGRELESELVRRNLERNLRRKGVGVGKQLSERGDHSQGRGIDV